MITAKEEKQLADMITGISEDRTSKELQEMRDLRTRSKAGARDFPRNGRHRHASGPRPSSSNMPPRARPTPSSTS